MSDVLEAKVRPFGNSLGIILPNELVLEKHLRKGQTVKLAIWKQPSQEEIDRIIGIAKGAAPFERDHNDREFVSAKARHSH